MATIHVDASLLIYHQELRILSSVSWFFFSIKNAHHLGEHFFDLIASGLLLFEMVVSSYHPCRILMMRKLQLRLVC